MSFAVGLVMGLVIGGVAGAAAIAAWMGLHRVAIDEIRAHCADLVDQLGEPTQEPKPRRAL